MASSCLGFWGLSQARPDIPQLEVATNYSKGLGIFSFSLVLLCAIGGGVAAGLIDMENKEIDLINIGENQMFTTNYKGLQIEIFLSDVGYAFVIRKDDFEDIEKGHRTPKEALLQAKRLIDAGEKFSECY